MSTTRSRHARRAAGLGAALLLSLPVTLAGPAQAGAPPNDEITGATRISQEPASHRFDTSEATRDAEARPCVLGRSVWFRFRATRTERLRLTTAGSTYDTVLALFKGRRRSASLIACADDSRFDLTSSLRSRVRQGRRYWVAVSSYGGSQGGAGVLTVGEPVPPAVDVAIVGARAGKVSGRLFVSGRARCASASSLSVEVVVSQRVATGGVARGTGFGEAACDAATGTWEAVVDSETGWAFQRGRVAIAVVAQAWNGFSRATAEAAAVRSAVWDHDARPTR